MSVPERVVGLELLRERLNLSKGELIPADSKREEGTVKQAQKTR